MRKIIAALALALAVLVAVPQAHAQKGRVYRVGFLTRAKPIQKNYRKYVDSFRNEMRKLGYIEGKNFVFVERWGDGSNKSRIDGAAELVRLNLDVITVHGGGPRFIRRALKDAGKKVPIVFLGHPNPVALGDAASLARPGGDATGTSDYHGPLSAKRLGILKEINPSASSVAVLWDSFGPTHLPQLKDLQAAAPKIGMRVIPVNVNKSSDFPRAFAEMRKERPGALIILGAALNGRNYDKIARFALNERLPAISPGAKFPRAGGLISYGSDNVYLWGRAAHHVDLILKGAKPGDIPVELPRKFIMTINLKTAKKMGVTIPPGLLLQATKVIK